MTDVFTSVLHPFGAYRLGRRLRSIADLTAALLEVALRGFVNLNLPDMLKPALRFFGVLFHEDGSMVTPGQTLDTGTSWKFNTRELSDVDGNKYHTGGLDMTRNINGKHYVTSGGGYYRHDQESKEDKIARRERELADLHAS
jgi:hypothetical protein